MKSETNTEISRGSNPIREWLEILAQAQGLRLVGAVALDCQDDFERYQSWISRGRHAGMEYLERHAQVRQHPQLLLPEARAAIVVALSYADTAPADSEAEPRIAGYARFPDYHRVLPRKLDALGKAINEKLGDPATPFRVLVDTSPVLERALAARASAGFIGKNTLWIHPRFGSKVVLGEILTAWELPFDVPSPIDLSRKTTAGGCGPCRVCQTACPTGALNEDYSLDARLCLSYWTIEHRGPIPEKFWPHLGKFVFGCDICQDVCPYNVKAKEVLHIPADLSARQLPDLYSMAVMDQKDYERFFGGTPLTRAKRAGLRRNALIAMSVTGHPRLQEALGRVDEDGGFPLEETVRQIRSLGMPSTGTPSIAVGVGAGAG